MKTDWRKTRDYRVWRAQVIRRDTRCSICNTLKDREAHHKNSGSYFPDERFEVDNGVCLCKKCHTDFHTNFKRSFREKCTKYDYDNFVMLIEHIIVRIEENR